MPVSAHYKPDRAHEMLGDEFYDPVDAAVFPKHILRFRNERAAASVGLDALTDAEWIAHFGRFEPLPGSFEKPLALRYHGHQFRHYNPDLGDGRGFLFAQLRDGDGRLLDLGTKGSGQTPWSRQGDGRLTLKGGVREALATAMLEALGVDTSKTFSLIETGEALTRGDEPSPTRSSVLVRLSHSHIRIGTFQRLAFLEDAPATARLLDYVIETYTPHLAAAPRATRPAAFLAQVCERVAATGAAWMAAGFVHGVLNTDNINVTGESFDYGPWRFAPTYDPEFTAAYFDENRLYAFGRQPATLAWNCARLAECLLPLAEQNDLEAALGAFEPALQRAYSACVLRRLGLASSSAEGDARLAKALLDFFGVTRAPFEQSLFELYGGFERARARLSHANETPQAQALFAEIEAHDAASASDDQPYFAGEKACTMLIDEVEAIWAPIAAADDWSAFHTKLRAIDVMREAYASVQREPSLRG